MENKKVYKPQVKSQPLRYMWIAHFEDGTSIPEFDPFTFEKNTMNDVFDREEDLIKFGIYPIPASLSKELNERGIEYTYANPFLPKYEINLDNYKRLIFFRRNFIHNETYRKCRKCGCEFQSCEKTNEINPSPICPKCGTHDFYVCTKCDRTYKLKADAKNNMCHCGAYLKRERITSGVFGRERRVRETHLGYQETIKGINKKTILKIDKNGNSEMVYQE